jgi:hypothetical protein
MQEAANLTDYKAAKIFFFSYILHPQLHFSPSVDLTPCGRECSFQQLAGFVTFHRNANCGFTSVLKNLEEVL